MGGTILVVGATGTTGRVLVRKLARAGVAVRAAARERKGLRSLDPAAEIVEIDYANPLSLARALRGVSKVYMAAPLITDMVSLTECLVAAAKQAEVSHFVKLSGMGVDSPDRLQAARWHREAEGVVEGSGMQWTHLRPNSFMQNFTIHHLGSMKSRGLFYDPVGSSLVSYIDVEDIAAVAATVLTTTGFENQVLTLTGPEAISSHQAAAAFSLAAGREIRCVEISIEACRDAMYGFGLPEPVVDAVAELYQAMRDGCFGAVTTTVPEIIGRPARSFAQFAIDQASLFQ